MLYEDTLTPRANCNGMLCGNNSTREQSVDACTADLEAMHCANDFLRKQLTAAAVERNQLTAHVRELTARLQQAEAATTDIQQIKLMV